jgi:hypothetical protein
VKVALQVYAVPQIRVQVGSLDVKVAERAVRDICYEQRLGGIASDHAVYHYVVTLRAASKLQPVMQASEDQIRRAESNRARNLHGRGA